MGSDGAAAVRDTFHQLYLDTRFASAFPCLFGRSYTGWHSRPLVRVHAGDTQTPPQGMEEMGNERAKAHFEANVPANYSVPREHATVREREKWIRDKYEHRRFVARDPPPSREKKTETSSSSRSSR